MSKVAFLWDESFLWGLMAYNALRSLNLPFDLMRRDDIRNGSLKNYRMLFVPGGWASNKLKTLGEKGIEEIRRFVHDGGNYFGICGGAGLATLDGIGLLNIKRKPTSERVPSFSGRIHLNISDHPVFTSSPLRPFTPSPIFHAWWPSQFVVHDSDINVLATFGKALPDAFSSDLNVGDVEVRDPQRIKDSLEYQYGGWKELEGLYRINLDPGRLMDEPAVVEGNYGRGKVLLSLVHFDTPDDRNGAEVLKNIWRYVADHPFTSSPPFKSESEFCCPCQLSVIRLERQSDRETERPIFTTDMDNGSRITDHGSHSDTHTLMREVEEMINFGIRNFLWFWRTPMLLQWRRGVRGLEYCTLYMMIKKIAELIEMRQRSDPSKFLERGHGWGPQKFKDFLGLQGEGRELENSLKKIKGLLIPFTESAKRLLVMERYAMQNGHITYERCDDPAIQRIRAELFGNSKSYGGLFKDLIDEVDDFLYHLLVGK